MSFADIAKNVNELANSWQEFKIFNEKRLNEIERKGQPQAYTMEALGKINNAIDEYKERLELLEIAMQRPTLDARNRDDFNRSDNSFIDYIRKGTIPTYESKSLSTQNDSDGSQVVTRQLAKRIEQGLIEISPMRQLCSSERVSYGSLDYLIDDNTQTFANWREEADTAQDDTKAPSILKTNILVNEIYAQPQISKRLLDDAYLDIESWLIDKLIEAFSLSENKAFVKGDGSGKPKGILNYQVGKDIHTIEHIVIKKLESDSIINLYYSLSERYAPNAAFLMNRSVLQQVRMMKLTTGEYLWQPGLSLNSKDRLMGIPVYQSSDMPMFDAKDTPIIVLADFKHAYKIVDGRDIRILRDPFTNKPFVKFYTTKRVGGGLINGHAVKMLKVSSK